MTNNPENPPAFPRIAHGQDSGMTLRDYFAAKALNGCLSYSYCCPSTGNYHENASADDVAKKAYEYADAMLKQRTKGE